MRALKLFVRWSVAAVLIACAPSHVAEHPVTPEVHPAAPPWPCHATEATCREVRKLRASCDRRDGMACWRLGDIYLAGKGVKQEVETAFLLFSEACDNGHQWSCVVVGADLVWGGVLRPDPRKAYRLLTKACRLGFAQACLTLGYQLRDGTGVQQDTERAAAVFSQSCYRGLIQGCAPAGDHYAQSEDPLVRINADRLFQFGCRYGDATCCSRIHVAPPAPP